VLTTEHVLQVFPGIGAITDKRLRQLSLDLRGRPPSLEELEKVDKLGSVPPEMLSVVPAAIVDVPLKSRLPPEMLRFSLLVSVLACWVPEVTLIVSLTPGAPTSGISASSLPVGT